MGEALITFRKQVMKAALEVEYFVERNRGKLYHLCAHFTDLNRANEDALGGRMDFGLLGKSEIGSSRCRFARFWPWVNREGLWLSCDDVLHTNFDFVRLLALVPTSIVLLL